MADNISVKITADIVDLQAQFSVAKADTAALTQELNKLARQAASTGLTDELKVQLDAAAEAMLAAKAKSSALGASLKAELAEGASVSEQALQKMSGAAQGLVAVMSAGAAFEMGKSALENAAGIEHEADVLQLSTGAYQDFSESAKVAGVSTETVDTSIRKFVDNLGKAEEGSKAQADALKQLGVSAHAPADVALPLVAQGLLNISDASERAVLEVALFGKSGEEMNPALKQWAQGTDTLTAKLKEMGLILDPEVTKAAHEAEVKLDTAFDRFQVAYTPAVVSLTNALSGLLENLEGVNDQAGLFFGPGGVVNLGGGSTTTVPTELEGTAAKAKKEQDADVAAQNNKYGQSIKQIPDVDVQAPDIAAINQEAEAASRAAAEQRRLLDEQAQGVEQLALKRIAAAESANNFELSMGEESLDKWKQVAIEEADAKYAAELSYLNKKAAADKGNAVEEQKDLDQIKVLTQEHANQLAEINQQYLEKKKAQDQASLQDKIQSDNAEYSDTVSKLNAEVTQHQISAEQRRDAEVALATSVEQQELAMFDATHQNLTQGTLAWDQAMKQRQAIVDAFTKRVDASNNQLVTDEQQKWKTLGNSIESSFNSAIDGMLFQGKSFGQGMEMIAEGVVKAFLSMGEKLLEDWIETQIEQLIIGKTTGAEQATTQITSAAAIAGAQGTASFAGAPWPIDMGAPAFGASMSANALSYMGMLSLDVGAWNLKNDTVAQLHKGEMVVPQNFAEGMRSGRGIGVGAGDINMHYGPTINAREPATLSQMLSRESGEMLSWLNRQFRNGALRA